MQEENNFNNYDSSGEQLSLFLNLDGFEGPIDLLLHLSREQKVDLTSISIAELANQYIDFIEKVKILNIEIAADYLVMAAWLAFLKSKTLLPELENEDEAENVELISAELRSRLLKLQAMQKASEQLMSLPKLGESRFGRGVENLTQTNVKYEYEANLYHLLVVYGQITNNSKNAKIFLEGVNSSIAMHNVSTQFADGGEFGFGGEIGISTNKLPPRGPVGINQLTSYKYIVSGKGIIRP